MYYFLPRLELCQTRQNTNAGRSLAPPRALTLSRRHVTGAHRMVVGSKRAAGRLPVTARGGSGGAEIGQGDEILCPCGVGAGVGWAGGCWGQERRKCQLEAGQSVLEALEKIAKVVGPEQLLKLVLFVLHVQIDRLASGEAACGAGAPRQAGRRVVPG